jgi:hypothetical protein
MQLVRSGAVSVNGAAVAEPGAELASFPVLPGGYLLLRRGKRHWGLVRLAAA